MTVRNIAVERFSVMSAAPFETVVARIDEAIGHPDMSAFRAAVAAAPSVEEGVRCDRTIHISLSQLLSEILDTGLANNGGLTRMHALVGGSPAIDTVTDGTCPPPGRDQRGIIRPQDGNGDGGPACDIGSYEFVFTGSAPVQASQQPPAPTPPDQAITKPVPPAPVSTCPSRNRCWGTAVNGKTQS